MPLSLNAVACAMRTKNSGVQSRRARSARYAYWFHKTRKETSYPKEDTQCKPQTLETLVSTPSD